MNKRGWLRILEATIAILLISSVLLIVYSRNNSQSDLSENVYSLEKEILSDIALREDLRQLVLDDKVTELNNFAANKIPSAFEFSLKLCRLEETEKCKLNIDEVIKTKDKDVYVQEAVIAGIAENYNPKKIKIFVWEAG